MNGKLMDPMGIKVVGGVALQVLFISIECEHLNRNSHDLSALSLPLCPRHRSTNHNTMRHDKQSQLFKLQRLRMYG